MIIETKPFPLVAACLACLSYSACASDATSAPSSAAIRGEIAYRGPQAGSLRIAAFHSFPPRGAPAAEVVIDDPQFPQAFALLGLPPGRYFVLAMIDVDPGDGDGHNPHLDPGGAVGGYFTPAPVTLDPSRGPTQVQVELQEPAAAGWLHPPYNQPAYD